MSKLCQNITYHVDANDGCGDDGCAWEDDEQSDDSRAENCTGEEKSRFRNALWHSGNIYSQNATPPNYCDLPNMPYALKPTTYNVFISGDYEVRSIHISYHKLILIL